MGLDSTLEREPRIEEMRISLDPQDPAFNPAIGKWCKVWLNGEELKYCVTADEERGEVYVMARDEDGKPELSMIGGPLREYLRGEVRIQLPRMHMIVLKGGVIFGTGKGPFD